MEAIGHEGRGLVKLFNCGIENGRLGVGLAQTVIVDGHTGLDRQANKPQIRFSGLVYVTRGLQGTPDAAPRIDFVFEEQRQLEVVVGCGPAVGVAVVRAVLSFASSRYARADTERGRQEGT